MTLPVPVALLEVVPAALQVTLLDMTPVAVLLVGVAVGGALLVALLL